MRNRAVRAQVLRRQARDWLPRVQRRRPPLRRRATSNSLWFTSPSTRRYGSGALARCANQIASPFNKPARLAVGFGFESALPPSVKPIAGFTPRSGSPAPTPRGAPNSADWIHPTAPVRRGRFEWYSRIADCQRGNRILGADEATRGRATALAKAHSRVSPFAGG